MLRVLGCITEQHDLRLVVLAGLICLFACFSAASLIQRARAATAMRSRAWLVMAAVVFGCGVWATHFVAELAYQPGIPVGYDVGLTVLSLLIAVTLSWVGLFIAWRMQAPIMGGVVVGLAVASMHYVGMAAMRGAFLLHWDTTYLLASIVISVLFAAAAMRMLAAGSELRHQALAALILVFAICGLHFTAMSALTLDFDPFGAMPADFIASTWLAATVAFVTVLIVGLGLFGSVLDQRLAARTLDEAARLRAHVLELEATKRELEATAASLESALEAAAAASQAKSQFLATMSHELRTPLNAIIGFSEMLVDESFGPLGDPRYQEYSRCVRDSGRHLLRLINDVLDLSKLEAGRLTLEEDEVDLGVVAEEAISIIRQQAETGRLTVSLQLERGLPAIWADRRRILQVLLNLLANSIKFTPEGGTVHVSAFRCGADIGLAVADSGIGMTEAEIPRALERFGQIDNSLTRKYEGTGLGLPLSKRLIDLHNATFAITSAPGKGTTVTILFPAKRIPAARSAA
jgi:signal transduction histidine kinase